MIHFWADIYDPTFTNTVGAGPIPLLSVSLTRGLDKLTRVSADVPASMIRALKDVHPRRIADIYMQVVTPAHMPAQPKRSLGGFVLDDIAMSKANGSWTRSIQGTERLQQLKEITLFPGTIYDDATLDDIFNDVTTGLAAKYGWTADIDADVSSDLFSVRFDGSNPLKGIQTVVQAQGLHWRSGTTANTIEIGPFGDTLTNENGEIVAIEYIEGDTDRNLHPMVIESIQIKTTAATQEFYNYALYYGAGKGDARLTMALSTRPWVVQVSENGRDHWIVKNDASIATYGLVMPPAPLQFSRLTPVGATEAQQINAANALADAAKADMDRKSTPLTTYSIAVRNVNTTVRPGDKIHVRFDGIVFVDALTAPYKWLSLNEPMWVMSVRETLSTDGVSLQLEVAPIDRYMLDATDIIVGAIDKIEVEGVGVQPYPVSYPWTISPQPIDTSTPIQFEFPIFDNVLKVIHVTAHITRRVWTAVASSAASGGGSAQSSAAGGDHSHVMFGNGIGTVIPAANTLYNSAGGQTVGLYANGSPATLTTFGASGNHTHGFTIPDHTHDAVFTEVSQDTLLPEDCSLVINAELVTSSLFPDSGGSDREEIDITEEVLGKAGGWHGWHDVAIDCGTNRGDIGVTFFIEVEIGTVIV